MSEIDRAPLPEALPPLCEYAEVVILERLHKMLAYVEGVRQNEETEPVHQMRVWSRRSRAALDIFHVCFAGKAFEGIQQEVKTVTGALGQARDLDVMIETLRRRAEALPPEQQPGVGSFIQHLQHRRDAGQADVEKALTRLEKRDPARRFQALRAQQTTPALPRKTNRRHHHG